MRRTKAEAEVTRKQLLDAALTIFSRDGYTAARLDEIAEIAGVSKGAIFHHFGSKAELYNELIASASQRYATRFAELQSEERSACDMLRELLIAPVLIADKDPVFRAVEELMFLKTAITPELEAGLNEKIAGIRLFVDGVTNVVEAGIMSGEIRSDLNPRDVAVSLLAQQNGLLTLFLLVPEVISIEDQVNRIADMFLQGIVNT